MEVKLNNQSGKLEVSPSYDWHIGKQILKKLKENEDKIHQIEVISGSAETRGFVRSRIIRLAQSLIARGIQLGDIVFVCAVNHNDANIPFLSTLCIGAITVNLVVGMTKSEVIHIMSTARPKIIFSDPEMLEVIETSCNELGVNAELVAFGPDSGKYTSFSELVSSTISDNDFKCTDFDPETTVAFIMCSSGTTGLPKLVAINHKPVILSWMVLKYLDEKTALNTSKKDVHNELFFNVSSSYWISGISALLGSCIFGNVRLQMARPFSVETLKDVLEKYKPQYIFMNPNTMALLCKHPDFDNIDLSCFRTIYTGGMMIDYDSVKTIEKRLTNGKVVSAYGASEAGFLCSNIGFFNKSVGKMYPWIQWKVVDVDTETILGPNQSGELRVKSDYVMKYFNNEKATKEALDTDGYYKTGDLFYYDDDGYMYMIDRVKEIIKYCNYQIGASEIEHFINKMPGVVSSAVIGIPDSVCGDLPRAYVQKSPDADISEEDIQNQIKSHLSDYKQLRGGVFFISKIPHTHSGKLNRKVLKTLAASQENSSNTVG